MLLLVLAGCAPVPQVRVPPPTPALPLEERILELTNRERESRGLQALTLDPQLSDIARAHSRDMLANNFFAHENRQGLDGAQRLQAAGIRYRGMAENIFTMSEEPALPGTNPTALSAIQGWMGSRGHRENILNPRYTHVGIGVAVTRNQMRATQIFVLP